MDQSPLFLLAPPRSFTSLVSAVIGQHPLAFGFPELNLFMACTMEQFWNGTDEDGSRKAPHWTIMRHGLQRTVAQLYSGEQTIESIQMAHRWILSRAKRSTSDVYYELCDRLSPRMTVEKSPAYLAKPVYLERLLDAFPHAKFIHLVRHPIGMGESILRAKGGKLVLAMSGSVERAPTGTVVEPQFMWYDANVAILDFLDRLPESQWMRIRGESFLLDMDRMLEGICDWLGLPFGPDELEAMKHPENSPFACVGPVNARLGNDINFLRNPAIRPATVKTYVMDEPLSWRRDGSTLYREVRDLAEELGYQ